MADTEVQVAATIAGGKTETGDEYKGQGMEVVEEDQTKQLGGQAEDKNDLQQGVETDQKEKDERKNDEDGDADGKKGEEPAKEEKPMIEIFIGGLSPSVEDDVVQQAVEKVVEGVSSLRVTRRKRSGECRGWAICKVPDVESAQKMCEELKEIDGRLVGVHVSRRKALDPSGFPYYPTEQYRPLELPVEECSLKELFDKVRGSVDKQGLVLSTIRGVYYPRPYWDEGEGNDEEYDEDEEYADGTAGSPPMKKRRKDEQDNSEIDEVMKKDCPGCMKVINKYRSIGSNKTALAILNEYASRSSMEVHYEEEAEEETGMFKCQAKLNRTGNTSVYAQGNGSGKSKRDAKQLSAAFIIESLLKKIPEKEFLVQYFKERKKQILLRPQGQMRNNTGTSFLYQRSGMQVGAFGGYNRPLLGRGGLQTGSLLSPYGTPNLKGTPLLSSVNSTPVAPRLQIQQLRPNQQTVTLIPGSQLGGMIRPVQVNQQMSSLNTNLSPVGANIMYPTQNMQLQPLQQQQGRVLNAGGQVMMSGSMLTNPTQVQTQQYATSILKTPQKVGMQQQYVPQLSVQGVAKQSPQYQVYGQNQMQKTSPVVPTYNQAQGYTQTPQSTKQGLYANQFGATQQASSYTQQAQPIAQGQLQQYLQQKGQATTYPQTVIYAQQPTQQYVQSTQQTTTQFGGQAQVTYAKAQQPTQAQYGQQVQGQSGQQYAQQTATGTMPQQYGGTQYGQQATQQTAQYAGQQSQGQYTQQQQQQYQQYYQQYPGYYQGYNTQQTSTNTGQTVYGQTVASGQSGFESGQKRDYNTMALGQQQTATATPQMGQQQTQQVQVATTMATSDTATAAAYQQYYQQYYAMHGYGTGAQTQNGSTTVATGQVSAYNQAAK